MKTVDIRWYGKDVYKNLLLESFEDVLSYQELLAKNTYETFNMVTTDRIPLDRWDHYGDEGEYGNSFNLAVQKCNITGGRPILEFDKITNQKCLNILDIIKSGGKVIINSVGGYCELNLKIHEVLGDLEEYIPKSKRKFVINNNTKYINLENDPELETRTKEYLGNLDKNYSYILRLVEYSKDELIEIFKEFQGRCGKIVYVYTTGSNKTQMWEYCEAIIESGIKFVEFEFNSGYDNEHKEIVEYLVNNQITVKII